MTITREQALEFFSSLFFGEHKIPSEVKEYDSGYSIVCDMHEFGTYDWNLLTRLVVLSHDYCYRAYIAPHNIGKCKIVIHKRQREYTDIALFHPTIEQSITMVREGKGQNYGNIYGHNYKPCEADI